MQQQPQTVSGSISDPCVDISVFCVTQSLTWLSQVLPEAERKLRARFCFLLGTRIQETVLEWPEKK